MGTSDSSTTPTVSSASASAGVAGLVAALNERFSRGRPSNDTAKVGLFVVAFTDDWQKPFARWDFEKYGGNAGVAQHASGSIINPAAKWTFHDMNHGAFLLRPEFMRRAMLCAYATDGATLKMARGQNNFLRPEDDGCRREAHGPLTPRSFPPAQLDVAMRAQLKTLPARRCHWGMEWPKVCYNEVIFRAIGANGWYANLPDAIEAYIINSRSRPGVINEAKAEYRVFLRHFDLKPEACPLLSFDYANLKHPLSVLQPE